MNKVLQPYEDWLLLTRGKIEPKVGDKIKTIAAIRGNQTLQNNTITKIDKVEINEYFSKYSFKLHYRNTYRYIEQCYVEVPYPNPQEEAIKFANWIGENYFQQNPNNTWSSELTEVLFQLFKQQINGSN